MGLFRSLKDAILSKIANRRKKADTSAKSPTATTTQLPSSGETIPSRPPTIPEVPLRLTATELAYQLDQLAAEHTERLEWRISIVDLMKLVDMDSSYANRKDMALDLGYSEKDLKSQGSAEMNIWLHKKVMEKLSEDTDGDLTVA